MLQIEVEGLEELKKTLRGLKGDIHKAVLRGLRKGGKQICKVANANAKRLGWSEDIYFHVIRQSKALRKSEGSAGVILGTKVGENMTAPKKNRITYYKSKGDYFYTRFPEYGTFKQRAKPALRPAIESEKEYVSQCVNAELIKEVEKANGIRTSYVKRHNRSKD